MFFSEMSLVPFLVRCSESYSKSISCDGEAHSLSISSSVVSSKALLAI